MSNPTLTVPSLVGSFDWIYTDPLTVNPSYNSGSRQFQTSFAPGLTAGLTDRLVLLAGTLGAGASLQVDLTSYTDLFNYTGTAMARLRGLYVEHAGSSLASGLLVGRGGVQSPTAAPVLSASAGTMANGAWLVAYTYTNASGETMISPASSITLAGGVQQIHVAALALPAGATGVNYYTSLAPTGLALAKNGSSAGAATDLTAAPATNAAGVPQANTASLAVTSFFKSNQDAVRLRAAGFVVLGAAGPADDTGYVVNSTHKYFTLTNEDGANPADYFLALAGCSA